MGDFRGKISLMGEIYGVSNFYWAIFFYWSVFLKFLLFIPNSFKKKNRRGVSLGVYEGERKKNMFRS